MASGRMVHLVHGIFNGQRGQVLPHSKPLVLLGSQLPSLPESTRIMFETGAHSKSGLP